MTTSGDGVKWSSLGATITLGLSLIAVVGGVLFTAGSISENVRTLNTSMTDMTSQFRVMGATLIRLDESYKNLDNAIKAGGVRMDTQDRELAEIKAQLSALHDQVERQAPKK